MQANVAGFWQIIQFNNTIVDFAIVCIYYHTLHAQYQVTSSFFFFFLNLELTHKLLVKPIVYFPKFLLRLKCTPPRICDNRGGTIQ